MKVYNSASAAETQRRKCDIFCERLYAVCSLPETHTGSGNASAALNIRKQTQVNIQVRKQRSRRKEAEERSAEVVKT